MYYFPVAVLMNINMNVNQCQFHRADHVRDFFACASLWAAAENFPEIRW